MNTQQIWKYFLSKKVAETFPFGRHFMWVKKEDFMKIRNMFQKEPNAFHKGSSYRAGLCLKHVHAVDQGNYLFIHLDYGNHKKFLPLVLIHFFVDVLPYFILCSLKRKKLNHYFYFPLENKQLKRNKF